MDHSALTLPELLIVLALSAFAALSLALLLPSRAPAAARDLQHLALSARLEAIRRNVPVAVVYDPASAGFSLRLGASDTEFADPCSGPVLRTLRLADYRDVRVFRSLPDDLVWLPSGLGRACSGSGVYNGSIVLGGTRPSHRLVVSSAGRIRSERLP